MGIRFVAATRRPRKRAGVACSHRKHGSVRYLIQKVMIRTQIRPFVWLYHAIYALSVYYCMRRFGAIRGVTAVYLRRGFAGRSPFYGLSDIDLLVMIADHSDGRVSSRVRHEYELLRRRVPMLAEDELALYKPSEFRALYENSAFYRNRFEDGREEWRRLCGEDIFRHLPDADVDRRSLASQELLPSWNNLAMELLLYDGRPLYARRYVAYKAISDTACAVLKSNEFPSGATRAHTLELAEDAFPELSKSLSEVRGWSGSLLSSTPLPVDMLFDLYLSLAKQTCVAGSRESGNPRTLRIAATKRKDVEAVCGNAVWSELEKIRSSLDGIERMVLVPRLSFMSLASIGMVPEMLAGATVDAYDLILLGRRMPKARILRQFNEALEPLYPTVSPFFCDGELAVSLRPIEGDTVRYPRSSPEFFACLSSTKQANSFLELNDSTTAQRLFDREDALERRAESLRSLLGKADVYRLPVRSFFALFWEAARAACMTISQQDGVVNIPSSSAQIVEALSELTPDEAPVLLLIHEAYSKALRNEPSDAVRYMQWATDYAKTLGKRFEFPTEAQPLLPKKARAELTISVVIVTRNRSELLRRTLYSLIEQKRRPDQVVVVDNASSDDTVQVARSFARKLNLVVVTEEQIGIPIARNTGIAHSSGEIVAFLDDDCVADRQWLSELEIPFVKDPFVGAVGGSVLPVGGQKELVARFYRSRMAPGSTIEGALHV